MADLTTLPGAGAGLPAVVRRRQLLLPIAGSTASREQLAAYLALVDRPLTSLLARERLSLEAPGRLLYRSNPHRLLHWQVVPTLALAARWDGERLAVESTGCRLAGLGDWGGDVGFSLRASLQPEGGAVAGWAEVGLHSRLVGVQGAQRLARVALEHVLDRIERRLGRGFQRDVVAWLGRGGDRNERGG
ncbi:MAG: hypothetical protein VKO39_04295 [Cyanobacteriota bacterium]|nr:hypothetical protein [Cyanobacteriota bacterium]